METKKRSMCLRPLQKLESMNICICITKEGERECEAKPREKGNEIGNDVDKGQIAEISSKLLLRREQIVRSGSLGGRR